MTDLQHHYKEISPEQTVANVKQFFADNHFELRLTDLNESEAGTWYCHVDLYKDNVRINGTNGKGVNKEYALASGYAELYERFCNKQFFLYNYHWARDYMKKNKEKFNYYFSSHEKILNYDEELNNCRRIHDYIKYYSGNIPELEKAMMNYLTDGLYVGQAMHSLENPDEVIYVDPRLFILTSRSNGMAAGNTLNEALGQALSEIVEREAEAQLWRNFTAPHYAIKLESIDNPVLQKHIKAIHDAGYTFYLFDLSYESNMPVIMSLLLDKENGYVNVNFGAFPVFEIAAERVITELYQGIKTFHSSQVKAQLQIPFKVISLDEMLRIYGNSIDGQVFNAQFFNQIIYKDTYNHEVFIEQKVSNDEIVQYYINLQHKIPGIKFYYINNSLSDKMYAVHVLIENTEEYCPMTICDSTPIVWDDISVSQTLNQLNLLKEFEKQLRSQDTVDTMVLIELLNNLKYFNYNTHFIDAIVFMNSFSVEPRSLGMILLLPFINLLNNSNMTFLDMDVVDTCVFYEYKKYYLLATYIKTGAYTHDELFKIFNELWDFKITEQDIKNGLSIGYLLQQAYIKPLQKYLKSASYNEIIDVYVNNNHS